MDRCVFGLVHRFCLGLFCAGEDVSRPHVPRNTELCRRAWSRARCAALGSRLAHHVVCGGGCVMGTMADDGAMPRRASGNGGVVGSSITSGGQSGSWLQWKMNVRRIVNQFLLSTDERKKLAGLPPTFDSITADQACNEKLYEEFAFYLANQYKCGAGKNKGEHLKVGPAVNYLNSLAKQLSVKHKHVNDKTKYFFTCKDVNGSSDPWVWFNGVRSNMHGIIYERAAKRGEEIENAHRRNELGQRCRSVEQPHDFLRAVQPFYLARPGQFAGPPRVELQRQPLGSACARAQGVGRACARGRHT
jgi:hypothetical protein